MSIHRPFAFAVAFMSLTVICSHNSFSYELPKLDQDGQFDVHIHLQYLPAAGELADIKKKLRDEADRMWDATDGQMTYGDILIERTEKREDIADFWVDPQNTRAVANVRGHGIDGSLVIMGRDDFDHTFTHEAGHHFWGLGDEYAKGACYSKSGFCIRPKDVSDTHHCIMHSADQFHPPQYSGGAEANSNEFCTEDTHDPLTGNKPASSNRDGSYCPDTGSTFTGCTYRDDGNVYSCPLPGQQYYNLTSAQERGYNKSCFEKIAALYDGNNGRANITAPATPNASPPSTTRPPVNFDIRTQYPEATILMLDRSGSMDWPADESVPPSANAEICNNNENDDGDGKTDERDCYESRMGTVRSASKLWLEMIKGHRQKAGIVSFATGVSYDKQLEIVNNSTIGGFETVIDNLSPQGRTAIGAAIEKAIDVLKGNASHRAGLLITDGEENQGTNPELKADSAKKNHDIRIQTVSTGEASNKDTLSNVAYEAAGRRKDCANPENLGACFAQSLAKDQNWPVLIPRLPYKIQENGEFQTYNLDNNSWIDGTTNFPQGNAVANAKEFSVPSETSELKFVVSSTNPNFDRFDVLLKLTDPNGTTFTSVSSSSDWEVTMDRGFILGEHLDPSPGQWTLSVESTSKGDALQTGNITVVAVNEAAELFVDATPQRPENGEKVSLRVNPMYGTTINDLAEKKVVVEAPDGTRSTFSLQQGTDSYPVADKDIAYSVQIPDFSGAAGVYDVRVLTRSQEASWNQPGEPVDDGVSQERSFSTFELGRSTSFYRPVDEDHELLE